MDDINSTISQILSDPEKMQQVQQMAASLGFGDASATSEKQPESQPSLSSLAGTLSGLIGDKGGKDGSGAPDLSSLAGAISGIMSGQSTQNERKKGAAGFDAASLASMLNAGNPPEAQAQTGGINLNVLMQMQKAMSNLQENRGNIELLASLKPRLRPERAKKVDDAMRIMQIIQFLPLLKESGIFGEMDNILGGLGDGLGNIIGGIGQSLMPGLGGRR